MTQEEKAKAYDEAIERAKKHCADYVVETIFPELKESEDERIKKELIWGFKQLTEETFAGISINDIISWLEKQGDKEKFIKKELGCIKNYRENAIKRLEELEKQSEQILDNSAKTCKDVEQKPADKIQLGKKYRCIASPRYSTFMKGEIYKPEDKFLCSLMNFCSDCFESIEDGEQKPTDKVEPKFKVGDYIINSQGTLRHIINVDEGGYQTDGGWLSHDTYEKTFHLWTIQDAKDGDVLSWDDSKCIAIFKNIYDKDSFNSYGFVGGCTGTFELRMSYHDIEGAHPATKEQRDTLMKAMADDGYEWDAEKKELKKVEQKHTPKHKIGDTIYYNSFGEVKSMIVANVVTDSTDNPMYEDENGSAVFEKALIEQKSAKWSEEDETYLNTIVSDLDYSKAIHNKAKCNFIDKEIKWFKSLKDRIQPKQEWSEEDETGLTNTIIMLKEGASLHFNKNDITKAVDWLKSLRPQSHWKPSEKQMEVLQWCMPLWAEPKSKAILESLINDLKKLMEE